MAREKVSNEMLEKMKELHQKYEKLLAYYGELHLKRRVLEDEIQTTEQAFNELEADRQELAKAVQQQFGKVGTVNLTTGEFEV